MAVNALAALTRTTEPIAVGALAVPIGRHLSTTEVGAAVDADEDGSSRRIAQLRQSASGSGRCRVGELYAIPAGFQV